jgi:hypothetical protein
VIDAFSSDAVPVHLLTADAFDIYARRLSPDGLLLMHVSNRFLDLQPVVAAAGQWGWQMALRDDRPDADALARQRSESRWIVLSRDASSLDAFLARTGRDRWAPVPARPGFAGWTDDIASILPLIRWPIW